MSDNILHSPALYRDMVIATIPELSEHMSKDDAVELAHKIAKRFCADHGGKAVRVPLLKRAKKLARDEVIRQQVATMSVEAIAKEHSLSERHVREILRGE